MAPESNDRFMGFRSPRGLVPTEHWCVQTPAIDAHSGGDQAPCQTTKTPQQISNDGSLGLCCGEIGPALAVCCTVHSLGAWE
jgi:hypothetical protein